MKTIIFKSREEAVRKSALMVLQEIRKKPTLVLGLATGKTMVPFYKELVSLYNKNKISFKKVKTFNVDEYRGLSPGDRNSYRRFMEKHFFNLVDIQPENVAFLDGMAEDWRRECLRYELAIKKIGGIDMVVLGIGVNGHIAFNEPGSLLNSKTRCVKLSEMTRKCNSEFFASLRDVPHYALTIGLSTILKSRKIILLAFGEEKKKIVSKALNGKINSRVPASFLRKHKNAVFILDRNASF